MPQLVLSEYSRLTGIKLRVVSHDQEAQAIEFVKHGFTIADLESVIAWTILQIMANKNGFSQLSLQWRVLFGRRGAGDEWQTFNDRLAMSQKTVRTRPVPREVPRTTDVGDGKITVFAPEQEPEAEPASDLIRQQFEQMKAANAKMREAGK